MWADRALVCCVAVAQVYSPAGRRLFPPIRLGWPAAFLTVPAGSSLLLALLTGRCASACVPALHPALIQRGADTPFALEPHVL